MKKVLSILLAVSIAAGCAVLAEATEVWPNMREVVGEGFDDLLETQAPFGELPADVTIEKGKWSILSFTPKTDGMYYFYFEDISSGLLRVYLADSAYVQTGYMENIIILHLDLASRYYYPPAKHQPHMKAELEKGETCYLFASTTSEQAKCRIAAVQMEKLNPVLHFIYRYLLFGWSWMDTVTVKGEYLYPGQKQYGLLVQSIAMAYRPVLL